MGYLNKATITVDAILTNKGRELLAKGGRSGFSITKFAVADDEIDYALYNDNHPNGDTSAGLIIENMPVLEATPDEQQIMRYKLVTATAADFLRDNTVYQPIINGTKPINLLITPGAALTTDSITLSTKGGADTTINESSATGTETGYTVLISDGTLVDVFIGDVTGTPYNNNNTNVDANGSLTVQLPSATNAKISFRARPNKTNKATATVYGNTSGATATFAITVSAATTATT